MLYIDKVLSIWVHKFSEQGCGTLKIHINFSRKFYILKIWSLNKHIIRLIFFEDAFNSERYWSYIMYPFMNQFNETETIIVLNFNNITHFYDLHIAASQRCPLRTDNIKRILSSILPNLKSSFFVCQGSGLQITLKIRWKITLICNTKNSKMCIKISFKDSSCI